MKAKYQEDDVVEYIDGFGDIQVETILNVWDEQSWDNGIPHYNLHHYTDSVGECPENRIIRLVGGPRFIPSWKATKCHRYKGTKEEYMRYMDSHLWKRKRAKILAREYKRCRICGKEGWLHVHHITYDRFGREEEGDLVALCPKCHDFVHYMVDSAEYLLADKDMEAEVPLVSAMVRADGKPFSGYFYKPQLRDFLDICVLTMLGEPFDYNNKIRIRAQDGNINKFLCT